MRPLSPEQTKGTLTFHLPLERDATTPPQMTIVVRRIMWDRWHAAISVCSRGDSFVKRVGRKLAFDRLHGGAHLFMESSPEALLRKIENHLELLNLNRPHTVQENTIDNVCFLGETLQGMRVE